MPRILLCMSLLLSVSLLAQEKEVEEQSQEETSEAQEGSQAEPVPEQQIAIPPDPASTNSTPSDTASGDPNRQENQEGSNVPRIWAWVVGVAARDTPAQWVMAIFAIAATGISVWAVWLLRLTLQANRTLLKHSKDTVDAANRAANASEDTAKQNRAWVTLSQRKRVDSIDLAEGIVFEFKTVWKNSGASPALDVEIEHRTVGFEVSDIGDSIPVFEPSGVWDTMGVMGPGCTNEGGFEVSRGAFDLLHDGTHRMFIYTFIRYKNIYKDHCITETVEEIKAITKEKPGLVAYALGEESQFPDSTFTEEGVFINYAGTQQRAT